MGIHPQSLTIVHYPHEVLKQVAAPIEQVTDEVRAVAKQMLQLMHDAPGVGLAAPQVGLSWRMFVANPTGEPKDDRVFINPKLTSPSQERGVMEEGCLSLPGIHVEMTRPTQITIEAISLDGEPFTLTDAGLPARIWQHEYDHLQGVLILDNMSRMDRLANRKQLKRLESGA